MDGEKGGQLMRRERRQTGLAAQATQSIEPQMDVRGMGGGGGGGVK